ncbi:MAG: hypothetical protein Q4A66_13030, partial [Eubacteriales bacterium]|nr:hypothetical protein [Eubacteriales bacterium]
MSTKAYNCPCCGAPLSYGAQSGKLECASCGNQFDIEAMDAIAVEDNGKKVQFESAAESFGASETQQMHAYICRSCGAELMTESTTTATECPYCGSPTVLPDRIAGGVRPEKVVPFKVTKEEAQKQFEEYFKGKMLLPNVFLHSRNRISEMRKLYVPYWLFDCDAEARIHFNAEKHRTERHGDWEIERVRHYRVLREGEMSFENIPVDGSEKLDNKITESLEPYDLNEAVAFQPAVLAGAMADHADVKAEACEGRAVERVENSIADALRDTVVGYTFVTETDRNVWTEQGTAKPVLMPVWLITTEKEQKTYTFAINGQTGKLTCDVPADVKKSILWGGGVFAGVLGIAALVLFLMEMLESGTILLAAIAALVIALIVLGVLRGQLKQAAMQGAAANYIKPDSFRLTGHHDIFLYETTTRRKIERQGKKD